jgi:hypothetical protein
MKATIYQYEFMYSFELPTIETDKVRTIVNAAVYRFYQFAKAAKKCGVKSANFNQPLQLMIANEQDLPVLDTAWSEDLSIGLIFQRTPEGVARFAEKVLIIVQLVSSPIQVDEDNLKELAEAV